MDVYIFQGALYCEECAQGWFATNAGCRLPVTDNGCSETFPQGPFANGGGEADSPSHCDSCGRFLENPLTSDGLEYVREQLERYGEKLGIWGPFYLPEEWARL